MNSDGFRSGLSDWGRRMLERWPLMRRHGASPADALARCTLQLEAARAGLTAMGGEELAHRNVILCGCPRSGTSLLSAALFQPPRTVTVMEPWEGLCVPTDELFRWSRAGAAEGRVPNTRLDVEALRRDGSVVWNSSPQRYPLPGTDNRTIHGVKWPCFWQLLGASREVKFLVSVRDPAAVVSSMERQGGRLRLGLDYDVPFNAALNERLLGAHDDQERRRVAFFDEVYSHALRFQGDPNVMFVRYERWFEDSSMLLNEISQFLGQDVTQTWARVKGRAAPALVEGGSSAEEIRAMSSTAARLGYA